MISVVANFSEWTKPHPHRSRAKMSCALASIFSSLAFLSLTVSMANLSRLVAALFSSLALLSFSLHGKPELLARDHLLQSYFSLQLIFIISLQSFESGQALFLVVFCFLSFASYPLPFFPMSTVAEALCALSFLFLSERFFFVHAKAALALGRNE